MYIDFLKALNFREAIELEFIRMYFNFFLFIVFRFLEKLEQNKDLTFFSFFQIFACFLVCTYAAPWPANGYVYAGYTPSGALLPGTNVQAESVKYHPDRAAVPRPAYQWNNGYSYGYAG